MRGGRASWVGEVPWVFWGEVKRGEWGVRGGRATRREGKAKGGERSPAAPAEVEKEVPNVGDCITW